MSNSFEQNSMELFRIDARATSASPVFFANSFEQSYPKLPYDILNLVFEYFSNITDSGWILEITNQGKIRMLIRKSFSRIHTIFQFKTCTSARYVQLHVQMWEPIGYDNSSQDRIVEALEQPYIGDIPENQQEFSSKNLCYIYIDPITNNRMTAYTESRNYHVTTNPTFIFHQGCVYDENENTYVISGFGYDTTPNTVRIVINPYNMIWDMDDDHWSDEYDIDVLQDMLDDDIAIL